jgi:hypothetical protein
MAYRKSAIIIGLASLFAFHAAFADGNPLSRLIGTWEGDAGIDIAPGRLNLPQPAGTPVSSPYYERIEFSEGAGATNASVQDLVTIRYHQMVFRKSDHQQFHDQIGYWIWDKKNNMVYDSFCIPRAVCAVAEGTLSKPDQISLQTVPGNIGQSQFMTKNARTDSFSMMLKFNDDGTISYSQRTDVFIYGKQFAHIDADSLKRVSQ